MTVAICAAQPYTSEPLGVMTVPSGLDEIEKLGTLRNKRLINEEEFQREKKQLLGL